MKQDKNATTQDANAGGGLGAGAQPRLWRGSAESRNMADMIKRIRKYVSDIEDAFKLLSGSRYISPFIFQFIVLFIFGFSAILPSESLAWVGSMSTRVAPQISDIYYYQFLKSIQKDSFANVYIGGFIVGMILSLVASIIISTIGIYRGHSYIISIDYKSLIYGSIVIMFFVFGGFIYIYFGISYGYAGDETTLPLEERVINSQRVENLYVIMLLWTGIIFGGICRYIQMLSFVWYGRLITRGHD